MVMQVVGLSALAPRWFRSYPMVEWDHTETRHVDHVIGAFFLVRRRVFESLGGFDERFFMYLEDLDFSLRARQAGWRTTYLADVRAQHVGGGTSAQVKRARLFYALRSRFLYVRKHFAPLPAASLIAGTLLIEPFPRLVRALFRASPSEVGETLGAFAMLWRYFLSAKALRPPGTERTGG
jgi:GT2 family glycosyltransferase